MWKALTFTVFVVFLTSATLNAATYYVSHSGNNANPGTRDEPWATISKANGALRPGDSLFIRTGVYSEHLSTDYSGTSDEPIYIGAMPGEQVIVQGAGSNLVVMYIKSYTVVEGLTVKNAAYTTVPGKAAYWVEIVGEGIVMRRCRVIADGDPYENYGPLNLQSRGISVAGLHNTIEHCFVRGQAMGIVISGGLPRHAVLRFDTLYNHGSSNIVITSHEVPSRFDDRIQATLIEDCVMDTSWDEDNIQFEPNYLDNSRTYNNGVIIRRCLLGHAAENCLDFKGAGNIYIDHCYLYGSVGDNNGSYDGLDNSGGAGIELGDGEVTQYVVLRNCVIWDNHTGAKMYDGYRYYNNVFVNNRRNYQGPNQPESATEYYGMEVWNRPWLQRAFVNNIIANQPNRGAIAWRMDNGGKFYLNNNLYFDAMGPTKFLMNMPGGVKEVVTGFDQWRNVLTSYAGYDYLGGKDEQSLQADPQFVNVPTYPVDYDPSWNFGLRDGSPAIDAGRPVTSAMESGSGSTSIIVEDARFFCDGFGVADGDLIKIGSGEAVRIASIDTLSNTITLESPRSWNNGDGVHLAYEGAAPDIGAFEFVVGAPQAPDSPDLLLPANGASNLALPVQIAWNATASTLAYYPQVASDANFGTIVSNPGAITETSYSIHELTGGTTYYWRVRSGNGVGVSPWSSGRSFTTAVAIPNAPATPELVSPAPGASNLPQEVVLRWNRTEETEFYYPQAASDPDFITLVANPEAIAETTFAVTGLGSGTTYYWRVRSGNSGGVSPWSSVRSFTTAPAIPAAPQLLSPGAGATSLPQEVLLRWNRTEETVAYYPQVASNREFTTLVANPGAIAETTYTVTGLELGATYYWRVRSGNQGGLSDWSSSRSFTTQVNAPTEPETALPVTESTGVTTNPLLSWSSVPGATSYTAQLSSTFTFSSLVLNREGITELSTLVEGLSTNTKYYWRVRAIGQGGTGAWSNVASFTTFDLSQFPAANAVHNSDFDSGVSDWSLAGIGSGTLTVSSEGYGDSSAARISVINTDAAVQLYQDNLVLNPDTVYHVSFAARSSSGDDCEISLMKSTPPHTAYGMTKARIDLGTTWNVISMDFTPSGFTTPVNDARLLFDFGTYATPGDVVLLDQIAIEKGKSPVMPPSDIPKDYFLEENYPNPFNPKTTIKYSLPTGQHVVIKVINLLGQEILELVHGFEIRGWHEVILDLRGYASGIYLVTLFAGEYVQTRKVMFVK
jgi:hypothetical protein